MSDHTTHSTVLAVQTDGLHRVIIEPVEPIGCPGAWFRMWESTVFSGLLARMSGGEVRLFWAIAAHRQRDGGVFCLAPEKALCDLTGRSLYQVRESRRALCTREGGRVCIHHGGDVYELMPGEPLLGRRPDRALPPPVPERHGSDPPWGKANASGEKPTGGGENPTPHIGSRARAPNPTQEKDRDKSESGLGAPTRTHASGKLSVAALERLAGARARGLWGWDGFPLYWSLEGVMDPALALTLLEVKGIVQAELIRDCPGVTVAEIDRDAKQIVVAKDVLSRSLLLVSRLYKRRGIKDPPYKLRKMETAAVKRGSWDEMRALRHEQMRRAAGG